MLARLKPLLTSGAASIAAGVIATNLIRIVSSVVLTRLLDPSAYGVVGILMAMAMAIVMLTDTGINAFVIRHKLGDDPAFLDQMWTLRLIRSFALMAVMILLAGPYSAFLGKPFVAPVLMVWSVSFALEGLSSMGSATAVRDQLLWRLSLMEVSAVLVQLVVATTLALFWPTYWVIPLAMVAGSASTAILSYPLFPQTRRTLRFDRERTEELWRFSRFIAPSSMLTLLLLQADKVFLAKVMTLSDFGHYAIAATLAAVPVTLAHPYASRVLFPAYSQAVHEGGDALRRIFYAKRRNVACLFMFAVGGFIGAAPSVIALLYDDRYHEVAPILQILLISAGFGLANWSADQALMALGKLRATLMANVVRVVWLSVAAVSGYLIWGVWGVIVALGSVEVAGMASYWWYLSRNGLLDVREEALGFAALALGIAVAMPLNALLLMVLR